MEAMELWHGYELMNNEKHRSKHLCLMSYRYGILLYHNHLGNESRKNVDNCRKIGIMVDLTSYSGSLVVSFHFVTYIAA